MIDPRCEVKDMGFMTLVSSQLTVRVKLHVYVQVWRAFVRARSRLQTKVGREHAHMHIIEEGNPT